MMLSLVQNHFSKVTAATIIVATSLSIGFYLGSCTITPHSPTQNEDNEYEDEDRSDGDLAAIKGIGPCKLVLIVRTDLEMTPGTISA
jgi:peptidyl-tRNA hydrolase, PTH2 family